MPGPVLSTLTVPTAQAHGHGAELSPAVLQVCHAMAQRTQDLAQDRLGLHGGHELVVARVPGQYGPLPLAGGMRYGNLVLTCARFRNADELLLRSRDWGWHVVRSVEDLGFLTTRR